MKKVPTVRFKGFTDDWEQRKLFDCIEKILDFRGRTPKKLGMDWSDEGYLALSALNVKDGYIDFSQDVHYGNRVLYDKWMTGNELHKGQVLFTTEAPMGNVAQVPDGKKYILSQRTIAFLVKNNIINEDFLAAILRSPKVRNELLTLQSGGTAKGVSQKSLSFVKIELPRNLKEQIVIAQVFHGFDSLITLHQRKLDQLQTLKNYCLQNMFPAKGEKAPAIRLKGFMDDWKQHKLGELLTFRNGFNGNSQQYGSGIPLISVMDILNNNFIFSDLIRSKAALNETEIKRYAVHYGDVLFQRSSETAEDAGTSNVYLDSQNIAVFGGFVICGRKIGDYDPVFLKYLLDSNKIRRQIVIRAQGAQHVNVSQDTLKDISIDLPSMSEQKMIGAHLYNLDNLITLQQRKLDQLQSLKKFMLQNLFI